jgi:hydroxymethylpyrimidine/phosphomethylpyrimidine kinase
MSKKNTDQFYPVALTVAGSDSGGGAGIQADLRTFNAFGVYGASAITSVTSQNPLEVRRIDTLPAAAVKCQLDTVLDRLAVRWAKSGMLASADIVDAVAATVAERKIPLVCDPVMVSTSGARLLEDPAVETMRRKLLPAAKWITPNLPEAELLLDTRIDSLAKCADAAKALFDLYGTGVLLKTGHAEFSEEASDVVCRDGRLYLLVSERIEVPPHAAHGTGCTLSAALAAGLAAGAAWKQALCDAKAFVLGSLAECAPIGPELEAMYPPVGDFCSAVKLKNFPGQGE